MSNYQKEIGEMLRSARKLSKTDIETAANEAGVHTQTVYKYERGDLKVPPIKLFTLCLAYALNGAEADDLQKVVDRHHSVLRTNIAPDLPRQLRSFRKKARLSQRELAKIIGIDRSTETASQTAVSEIERGTNVHPHEWEAAQKWVDEQGLKYKNSPEIVLPLPPKPKSTIVETIDMQELFNEFVNFITNIAQTERRVK